jgi:hypothetical protein
MAKAKEKKRNELADEIGAHLIEFLGGCGIECVIKHEDGISKVVESGDDIRIGNLVIDLEDQAIKYCKQNFKLHDPGCFDKVEAHLEDCLAAECGKECKHYHN